METTNESRKLAAKLVENIVKLLDKPLAEAFRCYVKSGYHNLAITTLIQGSWTVGQQFDIIRKALKDLKADLASQGDTRSVPWEDITMLMLRTLEQTLAVSSFTQETRAPSAHTSVPLAPRGKSTSVAQSKAKGIEATKPVDIIACEPSASSGNIIVPTDPQLVQRILEIVAQPLKDTKPLYATYGQRYVKCNSRNCEFCETMFNNLAVTQCSKFGHTPCNSVGWYPHVGVSMWKQLRRQHDSGLQFIPKSSVVKPGELPRLSSRNHVAQPSSTDLDIEEQNTPCKRKRKEDEAKSKDSSETWAEEMS